MKRCALEFYSDETKHAKKRKEKLSKVTQAKLLVRASHKMAYYSELCNDFTSAVKHYSAAYTHLRDVKKNWKDFDEIKVVAEILNFRLCYLHLERNTPNNATTQFHQHINYYRSLVGDPDREFQHYAWVSRQYQIFGELLQLFSFLAPPPSSSNGPSSSSGSNGNSLSNSGLISLGGSRSRGWNHPGFYFQAAANFEIQRRTAANKLCVPQRAKDSIQRFLPLVLPYRASVIDFNKNSYVGQKVEVAVVNLATFNAEKDAHTMTVLLEAVINNTTEVAVAQELHVNHSKEVIHLLNVAQDAYRLDHTPNDRTIWHLISQIAQESFLAGDYRSTKAHNDLVIPHYRREKWWGLLAICLKTNLQCSIRARQWHEVLLTATELLSPSYPATLEERKYYIQTICTVIRAHRNGVAGEVNVSTCNPLLQSADRLSGSSSLNSSSSSLSSASPAPGNGLAMESLGPAALVPIDASQPESKISEPVVVLQSNPATTLLSCQVSFPQQTASINDTIFVTATLTSHFPLAMRFDSFQLLFTDPHITISLEDDSRGSISAVTNGMDVELAEIPLHTKQLAELAARPQSLILLPNKAKTFQLPVKLSKLSKIQCVGATLTLGAPDRSLQLKWDWAHIHKLSSPATASGAASTSVSSHLNWGDYSQRRYAENVSVEVLQLTPKLDLELDHEAVALEGERLPITIHIKNQEDKVVGGILRISPHLEASGTGAGSNASTRALNTPSSSQTSSGSSVCPFVSETGTNGADVHEIPIKSIGANQTLSTVVYFAAPRRQREEPYIFRVSFIYDTEQYSTTADRVLRLPIRAPFEVSFCVYDSEFRDVPSGTYHIGTSPHLEGPTTSVAPTPSAPTAAPAHAPLRHTEHGTTSLLSVTGHRVSVGSQFYILAEIHSTFDLQLQHTNLVPTQTEPPFQNLTPSVPIGDSEDSELHAGDKYSTWFVLKAKSSITHSLGMFSIKWKRAKKATNNALPTVDQLLDGEPNVPDLTSSTSSHWQIPFPPIFADSPPFTTKINCAATAVVGRPLEHELILFNQTDSVICLALEADDANCGFSLSGDLRVQYRLNAFAQLHVRHTLLPLIVGTQRCPKFHVKQLANDGTGLGPGGLMEPPFATVAHTDVFVEPNQTPPLIV